MELKNLIESMVVLSPKRKIEAEDVPLYLTDTDEPVRYLPVRVDKTPDQVEREMIFRTLLALKNEVITMKEAILERLNGQAVRDAHIVEKEDVPAEATLKEISFEVGTTMSDMEKEMIYRTLEEAKGNRRKAAQILGMSERTFYRRLQKYGLS